MLFSERRRFLMEWSGRLPVTFVQPVKVCGNVYTPFGTYFSHPLTFVGNFTEIVPVEPLCREFKRKRGGQI